MTAMAGAHLDSRFLLVVAGQVKSTDLSQGKIRQRGIQEADAKSLASPIASSVLSIDRPIDKQKVLLALDHACTRRAGVCFIEVCVDTQNLEVGDELDTPQLDFDRDMHFRGDPASLLAKSKRPLVIVGSEVKRHSLIPRLCEFAQIPVATTWTAMDRVSAESPVYAGRPNHYGMRWANLVVQQADAIFALGTRLGMQTTGFNVAEFAPKARIFLNFSDMDEVTHTPLKLAGYSTLNPEAVAQQFLGVPTNAAWGKWANYVRKVRDLAREPVLLDTSDGLDPYRFMQTLSRISTAHDLISVGSSGNGYTQFMQTFEQRGQTIVNSPALASMGYGLAGGIGLATSHPRRRTLVVEGDGGFAQNLQELGTLARQRLNLKLFILDNCGYQSIRATHERFLGEAMGCDLDTGLGLPHWGMLFDAYGIEHATISRANWYESDAMALLDTKEPAAFVVQLDPSRGINAKIQTIVQDGKITSAPLHLMQPELPDDIFTQVNKHLR
jgi:acetolactate synthase-1/2/3 large subunit